MTSLYKQKYQEAQTEVIKKMALKEVDALFDKAQRTININTNTVILGVLHEQFGWGHDRLLKFCEATSEYQKAMTDRYGSDCDVTAMKRRLKDDCGIDVDELVDKAEADHERGETKIKMGA